MLSFKQQQEIMHPGGDSSPFTARTKHHGGYCAPSGLGEHKEATVARVSRSVECTDCDVKRLQAPAIQGTRRKTIPAEVDQSPAVRSNPHGSSQGTAHVGVHEDPHGLLDNWSPKGVPVSPFYEDFAHVQAENPGLPPACDYCFPLKLHSILEYEGLGDVLGWELHGR
jgi:hypothetical protein